MTKSFQEFALLKGIKLLRDDVNFIKESLNKIPYSAHWKILDKTRSVEAVQKSRCPKSRFIIIILLIRRDKYSNFARFPSEVIGNFHLRAVFAPLF